MAKVVILSGAGISAESGILTFRDTNGLWENHKIEDVCESQSLKKNRKLVIDFYNTLRVGLEDKKPNYAHEVIAKLKDEFEDDIAVITQNVDDLFERTNCKDIIHLHGFLKEIRCNNCSFKKDIKYQKQGLEERCPSCNSKLRPNIVFFGEEAPMYQTFHKELSNCKMLVVIGTSGLVIHTDSIFHEYPNIKHSILNNLEKSDFIYDELYSKVLYKKASESIDEIAEDVRSFLNTDNQK